MRDWPLIGRAWRERECITCYLIPRGRIFDRLHAWHMAHSDDGLRLYPADQGWVVADDGGWIPGWWRTRRRAIRGARAYLSQFTDLPGPVPPTLALYRAGESAEDDEWVAELHSINQLGKMGDLTRPVAQLTHYEVQAVIRQLRVPDWLPAYRAAA